MSSFKSNSQTSTLYTEYRIHIQNNNCEVAMLPADLRNVDPVSIE